MGFGIWALLPISWLPNPCVSLAAFPRFQGTNNPEGLELEVQELQLPERSSHDVSTEAFPRPGEPLGVWPGGGSVFSKAWNPGSPALEWFKWNSWSELQKSGASLGVPAGEGMDQSSAWPWSSNLSLDFGNSALDLLPVQGLILEFHPTQDIPA